VALLTAALPEDTTASKPAGQVACVHPEMALYSSACQLGLPLLPVFGRTNLRTTFGPNAVPAGDEQLFKAAAGPLEVMGKASFFLGEVGAGANMKLVANMIMGAMMGERTWELAPGIVHPCPARPRRCNACLTSCHHCGS
jgi:hypothetical protein